MGNPPLNKGSFIYFYKSDNYQIKKVVKYFKNKLQFHKAIKTKLILICSCKSTPDRTISDDFSQNCGPLTN